MSVEFFFDTNLFIYQLEASDGYKFSVSNQLIRNSIEKQNGCISFQVVQECLNTMIRKAEIPMDRDEINVYMKTVLIPLWSVYPSIKLYQKCLDIQERYKFSFYDSLIIAATLEAGCTTLYSKDLQHGQQIDTVTVHNPFITN